MGDDMQFAEEVRAAALERVLGAHEDARREGLCMERAWEFALAALCALDVAALARREATIGAEAVVNLRSEYLEDVHGCASFGWVAPGVFYARLERTISADVASRFGRWMTAFIGDEVVGQYFADWSSVDGFQPAALEAIIRALEAKRHQFRETVARPRKGPDGSGASARLVADLGRVEYVADTREFYRRLQRAAPSAIDRIHQMTSMPPPPRG